MSRPARQTPQAPNGSWLRQQITIGNMINLGAIALACVAFYFNTNAAIDLHAKELLRHDKILIELAGDLRALATLHTGERDKLRAEMLQRAERTSDGISELNKTTAVLGVQLAAIKEELIKLGRQLEQALPAPRR